MEQRTENPLFGRKVYFLNPPLSLSNQIISNLRALEYEVYSIPNYQDAKSILRENQNAICFIFIDDQLPLQSWYNFIKSFEYDKTLESIFLGVLSVSIRPLEQQKFVMDLKLPGGLIVMESDMNKVLNKIIAILDLNGSKGRRKYIRLACKDDKNITGYFADKDKLFPLELLDISSVGFACITGASLLPTMAKNTLIKNISITIKRSTIAFSAVVLNSAVTKDNPSKIQVVLLFASCSEADRACIREYIFENLDAVHNKFMKNSMKDLSSYSQKPVAPNPASEVPELRTFEEINSIQNSGQQISLEGLDSLEDLEEI